ELDARPAGGDSPPKLRQGSARRPRAQDHPSGRLRARQLDLSVLRIAFQSDRRSRHTALEGRVLDLGEHRRLVCPVQPAEGRSASASGGHAPAPGPADSARGDLHPRGKPNDPRGLAAVPAPGGLIGPALATHAKSASATGALRGTALTGRTETALKAAGGT